MEILNSTHFEHHQEINAQTLVEQMGKMNVLAISGGRVKVSPAAVEFPVSNGYSVMIQLHWNDTYTVRRIFKRGTKVWVKGTKEGIYCEQVGEVAYYASCFRSYENWAEEVEVSA